MDNFQLHQQGLATVEIDQMIGELEECLAAARLTRSGIADCDREKMQAGLDVLGKHIGYKGKLVIGAGLMSSGATDETALFLEEMQSPEARREAWEDEQFGRRRDTAAQQGVAL
jgi:hypothetical protein